MPNVTGNVSCYNASIQSNATLTVNSGHTLNIVGDLTVKSDASGTGSVIDYGTLNVAGTTTFQNYYTGNGWHYISSPVGNAVSGMYLGVYLKWWEETSGQFHNIEPVNIPLNVGQGYAIWSTLATENTAEYVGTLNTGTISSAVTNSGPPNGANGWNFMGNPYPSSLDWDAVSLSLPAEIDAGLWIYDPAIQDYRYYLSGGGANTTSQYVAPAQGFFIHCNDLGGSIFTLNNAERVHSSQAFYKDSEASQNSLILHVDGFETSTIEVRFKPEATEAYDPKLDLIKLFGFNENIPAVYSKTADGNLAINSLPVIDENRVIPLGFEFGTKDEYAFTFTGVDSFDPEVSIFLEDKVEHSLNDLKKNNTYTFSSAGEENKDRFALHFKTSDEPQGLQSETLIYAANASVFIMLDKSYTNETVDIYDLSGQLILTKKFSGQQYIEIPTRINPGIYLVRLVTDESIAQEKLFIK